VHEAVALLGHAVRTQVTAQSASKTLQIIGGPAMSSVLFHHALTKAIGELEPIILDGQVPELERQLTWLSRRRGTM